MDLNPEKIAEIDKLVLESQDGNSEAFAKLYDHFIQPIYRYVFYRVGSDDAEDLTELIFLKTWENIRQYRKGDRNFSSWIFRIAHNVVVDHYRAHKAQDELKEDIEDPRREANTIERAHRRFDKELLSSAMAKLKDHYRQILILKYMNDLPNDEIAHITGRSQPALRILQFRALRALKRILADMGVSEVEINL
ncbi:MAG: sigma-70 family RNA polymerase sigma factor [Patescibacteria group bacterium]